MLMPAAAEDATIIDSAKFRSSSRLPNLTYFDKTTGTSIWRCSQPGVGVLGTRSQGDERLLMLIGQCNGNPKNVHSTTLIHDSRPFMNAMSNRARGGGYEDCGAGAKYPNCKIKFADIDNIHEVTKVYNKLITLGFQEKAKDAQTWMKELDKTDYRWML
jgi:hypothetical protein